MLAGDGLQAARRAPASRFNGKRARGEMDGPFAKTKELDAPAPGSSRAWSKAEVIEWIRR